jgi:hypothetical protein
MLLTACNRKASVTEKTSALAPMIMPSCIPMPLVPPLTAPATDLHTPLTPGVLDITRNLKVDANRLKPAMTLPKEEFGARRTLTTRLHPMGDKSRRRDTVDPSPAKNIASRKLPDMGNKRLAMEVKRGPLVDKGGPATGVRRSVRLHLMDKRKDMVARGKIPMADLLGTNPSPATRMGSKNQLDMVDAVILEAPDISLVDAKKSQAMDRAVTEVPAVVDVPKRWNTVRLAMEAPALLDVVKRQNMDKHTADTEAEALSGMMTKLMVSIA